MGARLPRGRADYPDVKREYAHVDATCMWMVKNPEWFDVIVTDNMFGDIITDLGAAIQGGLGIAFEEAFARMKDVADHSGEVSKDQIRDIVEEVMSGIEALDRVTASFE